MKTRLIFALVAAFTAPAFAQTDEPLAAATAFFTAWLEGNSERAAALLYFPPQAPACLAPDDKLVLVRAAFGALPEMVQAHQGLREITGNAAPSAAGHGDALRLPLVITAQDGTVFPRVVTLHHTADGWRIRL
jgi:sensory transduction histidine kinase